MTKKAMQPALLIGLGGSGTEVVRRFKRRFRDTYSETPYIQLLGIDTAPQEQETQERPLLDDDEFVYASNFNSDFFVGEQHIDRWPEIRAWWKGYKLPTRLITAGAGMRRPFGRLALYVHYQTIVNRIRSHLFRIFNNDVFTSLPEHYRNALNVYIVSSTCGGTGTGMFLDVAYLTQALVPQVMPGTQYVWVRGVLMLPSVFLDTGQVAEDAARGLRANALGALTELDACMYRRANLPPVRYPDNNEVVRSRSPFHSCFLMGSQTADGGVVTDFGALLERAAVHIQIELASPIMETGKARLDNPLEAIAAKPDSQGCPRLYSSFSNEWLELPSRRVVARWSRHLASKTLERLASADSTPLNDSILDQKDAYGRLRTLVQGRGLNNYLPRVDSFVDNLMDLGEEGRAANVLIDRARTLQSEAARQIDQTALTALVADCAQRLPTEVMELSRDSVGRASLGALQAFLSRVQEELNGWIGRARQDTGAVRSDEWLSQFQQNIQELKKGVLTKQEKHVGGQRQLVIDAVEQARDGWRRALRARVAGELERTLPAVVAEVSQMRGRVEQLLTVVDSAKARVDATPDPVVPAGASAGTVGDETIDEEFLQQARQEQLDTAVERRMKDMFDRGLTTDLALANYVYAAAHEAVLQVAPAYLATLDIPASQIAAELARLSPLCVFRPDWKAHPDATDVHRLWLVGLPESSSEKQGNVRAALPQKIRDITEFVLHRDEGRVVMTVQHHGFPLYAIAEIEGCKKEYDQSDPVRKKLCFVLPDEQVQAWRLMPASGSESREWFAVAVALGWIIRRGANYTFRAGDSDLDLGGHEDPGEARSRARDEFLRSGLASDVEARVNERFRHEGNDPVHAALVSWLDEQKSRIAASPGYPEEFKQDVEAVAGYADRIRPY